MKWDHIEAFEGWLSVPGYEGYYEVSNFGRLRSLSRRDSLNRPLVGRLLILHSNRTGYPIIMLSKGGVGKTYTVHKLVALAFLGECPRGKQVDHIDGDKTNNTVKNLRYVSAVENTRSAMSQGRMTYKTGEKNVHSRLTNAEVIEIRRLNTEGFSQRQLARKYGVSQGQISLIVRYKSRTQG